MKEFLIRLAITVGIFVSIALAVWLFITFTWIIPAVFAVLAFCFAFSYVSEARGNRHLYD